MMKTVFICHKVEESTRSEQRQSKNGNCFKFVPHTMESKRGRQHPKAETTGKRKQQSKKKSSKQENS